MNKKIANFSVLATLLITPFAAFAQPGVLNIPLTTLVADIAVVIFNILWTVAVAFVTVMFVIAGFKFATAQGNIEKVKEARNAVIWGLVGTLVVVLAWSMVSVIRFQVGV